MLKHPKNRPQDKDKNNCDITRKGLVRENRANLQKEVLGTKE